jgi:hypothetical protein
MTTKDDEIIDEVRKHREGHAASLDYDLKRITQDYQRQERESGREFITRPPHKPSAIRRPSVV